MQSLAVRLRAALDASGLSQADLARRCRVRAPSVSDWLSGESKSMKSAPLLRAAAALNVNALWLATGEGVRRNAVQEYGATQSVVVAQEPGIGGTWPFTYVSALRWAGLPMTDRLRVEMFADQLLQAHDATLRANEIQARSVDGAAAV